jgi:large subunit ribosomal protein L21
MFAVIKTGGKQYRVSPGDQLKVEKLQAEAGAAITFAEVLMVGEGQEIKVGSPTLAGAEVKATVQEHGRGPKLVMRKYSRRLGYHKKQGHRQDFTLVRIDSVTAG